MIEYETNPKELKSLSKYLSPLYSRMLGAWARAEASAVTRAARIHDNIPDIVTAISYTMPGSNQEFMRTAPIRYERMYDDMNEISRAGLSASGSKLEKFVRQNLKRRYIFDAATERATRFSREISLDLLKAVTMRRGKMLRALFSQAAIKDIPFNDAVELLRQSVTLTPAYASWVRKTYETVKAESGRAQALIAARKHSEKLRKFRARAIVRTETIRLMNEGKIEAGRQIMARGIAKKVMKMWVMTDVNDNWQSSLMNDGQVVDLDDTFRSGDQAESEINGRCVINLIIFENNQQVEKAIQSIALLYGYYIMKNRRFSYGKH